MSSPVRLNKHGESVTTTSEAVIDEPVTIELESHVQPEEALSCDVEDPSPRELKTRAVSVVQQVLDLVNRKRGQAGLSPLRLHSQLNAAAQAHSNDMARHNFLSHTGADGSSPFDRIRRYGYNYRRAGENIASGYSSAQDVMQGWLNSSGHRANILNPKFRDIGIGVASGNKRYWTQTFGS
jgi:uncharacterized protein YkwD